jgi:dipeptidyl aminopeptidase/acylaminoacyl peptidase
VERAVDLAKPALLSLFGKRTKQSGYARLLPSGSVQSLMLVDASVSGLTKADSTERYSYVKQSFAESPDVFVAGADLSNAVRWTQTNPFQSEYAWGKAELMNFTSTIGTPLQAILYYPANYDPAKKYPMIVYTYEMLSDELHRYIAPRENDYYNANVFTQNGYFVLKPDIRFRPREPGISVLHAVEPAVQAVIARGLVDPANIGHCGHSQGGYEAYYLATHSTLFKTAVAGAGISDMISFAGQMHWSSIPEFSHWETGQFRMQVPPWEDTTAMIRNSPLDKVHVMPAKSILMEIGGDDPVVDMRQGVLFYNYARRAGKDAVLLLYPGEGHGLGKRENAIDYERRILQWFAHYLKGETAAPWITSGQSWLQRKTLLDANK